MNSNHDKQLELEINRELKALPELTAPDSLTNRVLAAIEYRSNVPWYRQSWETWPDILRATSFAAMLVLFGALCLGGWELSQTEMFAQATQRAGHWFSEVNTIGNIFNILASSAVLVIKKLGTTFIIGAVVGIGLGYAMFLGLGAACFRLAFAKR
jgi:hypothetical protein